MAARTPASTCSCSSADQHAAALAASLLGAAATAEAQTPYRCSSTSWTTVPYRLQVGVDARSDYALDPASVASPRYDNRIRHRRRVVANRWVDQARIYFDRFETEPNYDYLDVSGGSCTASGCTSVRRMTGIPFAGSIGAWTPVLPYAQVSNRAWSESLQSSPLRLEFVSDASVTAAGVKVGRIDVQCSPGAYNDLVEEINPGESVDGLLLANDDIAYFALPGGATPGFHQTVALTAPDADADFDVYVRCGAYPTTSLYDFASRSSSNQEFIDISDTARSCSSRWYVGVHSYPTARSGRGSFRALFSRHRSTQRLVWRVGMLANTCAGSTEADRAAAADFLRRSSAEVFGATDGQVFLDWELYTVSGASTTDLFSDSWRCGGAPCNVRLAPCTAGGGGQAWRGGDRLWLGYAAWRNGGTALLHEFGHAHLNIEDYYYFLSEGGVTTSTMILPASFPTARRDLVHNGCGHSTMANGFLPSTTHSFCTAYNHLYDTRYVQIGMETNVLLADGQMSATPGASTVGFTGAIGDTRYGMSYTPVPHPTFFDARSDFRVGIDRGVLWMEPEGSGDPYDYLDFRAAGFPGAVRIF